MSERPRRERRRTFNLTEVIQELFMNSDSEGEDDFVAESSDEWSGRLISKKIRTHKTGKCMQNFSSFDLFFYFFM